MEKVTVTTKDGKPALSVTRTQETTETYSLAELDNIINSLQIELANEQKIVADRQAKLDYRLALRKQLMEAK